MNGAEALVQQLEADGITLVVANPGTSEMHVTAALATSGVKPVLGLAEGVVTGIADGYARVAARPAATLLHLGPGLANGLANLHNARRARTPIVNIVGDHATSHAGLDAPLASDIEAIAGTVGVVRTATASSLVVEVRATVADAGGLPGRVATLIVPADVAWSDDAVIDAGTVDDALSWDLGEVIRRAANLLRGTRRSAILIGGWAGTGEALETAGRIAASTGSHLLVDTFVPRLDHGAGRVVAERLPYLGEAAAARLADFDGLVCVGTSSPVSFFAYPGRPGRLVADSCDVVEIDAPTADPVQLLSQLADELGAKADPERHVSAPTTNPPTGPLDRRSLATAIAAALTSEVMIVDEGITNSGSLLRATAGAVPHQMFQLTGGAIGLGLPLATGAALADPTRRVIALEGDGSAMYTLQALWTMARESLDVTVLLCTNRRYSILDQEMSRMMGGTGEASTPLFDLGHPNIDAVSLAHGFGVPAVRVSDAESLHRELVRSLTTPGPALIDMVM